MKYVILVSFLLIAAIVLVLNEYTLTPIVLAIVAMAIVLQRSSR